MHGHHKLRVLILSERLKATDLFKTKLWRVLWSKDDLIFLRNKYIPLTLKYKAEISAKFTWSNDFNSGKIALTFRIHKLSKVKGFYKTLPLNIQRTLVFIDVAK